MTKPKKYSGETWPIKILLRLAGLVTWPLAWLPLPLVLPLGAAGGRLVFRLLPRRRLVATGNIEMIKAGGSLPANMDAKSVARASFANLGRMLCEVFRYYHRGLSPFMKDCGFGAGREHFEAALSESRRTGRGLLVVTGHMGNWEIMCQYAARANGFKLNIVGRDIEPAWLNALLKRIRTREGNAFISKDGGAREMLKILKNGGVLGTLIDQSSIVAYRNIRVPFLGRPATFNLGPILLARHTGASVIMALFRREGRRHIMDFFPALPRERPGLSEEEAVLADARELNECLGEFIKRFPDQWMWGHRRWKTKEGVRRDAASLT